MSLFVPNPLCDCTASETCVSCRFCEARNTPEGRSALSEKIIRYLVSQPIWLHAIARAMHAFFPDKIVYDDEQHICTMLFEAVLFEENLAGITPFLYFIQHAPLSADEKRLYNAWLTYTRHQYFAVEKVVPGKEIHLAELAGAHRYQLYERRATSTMKEGSVIIARIVPFFKGWMITTEPVLSYPGSMRERLRQAHERLHKTHGIAIPQFAFVHKHLEDHRRRMAG